LLLLPKQAAKKLQRNSKEALLFIIYSPLLFVFHEEAEVLRSFVESGFDLTIVTSIFTGCPLPYLATPYVVDWEENRQEEIKALCWIEGTNYGQGSTLRSPSGLETAHW
jgi:hypothetical protein